MNRLLAYAIVACSLSLGACATSPFPPSAVRDVDPSVGFDALKAQPEAYKGRTVELAGRIVDVRPFQSGTLVVAQDLPVKKNKPVEVLLRPEANARSGGTFTVLYPGAVATSELEVGDKVVVVGKMEGEKESRPYLVAGCMHVWQTGLYPIAGYEDLADLGLAQKTYCIP